jgi:hypothetical protein
MQHDLDTAAKFSGNCCRRTSDVAGLTSLLPMFPHASSPGTLRFLPYGSGRLGIARRCLRQGHGSGTLWVAYLRILREYTQDHRCCRKRCWSVERAAERGPHDSELRCFVVWVYDAGLRQMIVANAGAPRPVLARARSGRRLRVHQSGCFLASNTRL